jgi:Fungal fucose-specific lectin
MESGWNTNDSEWSTAFIGDTKRQAASESQVTAMWWGSGSNFNIRVYFQGEDGYIREAAYTQGNEWTAGGATKVEDFPKALMGSGLAAVMYPETDPLGARLYYQDEDNRLRSYDYRRGSSFDDSWNNGMQFPHPSSGSSINKPQE